MKRIFILMFAMLPMVAQQEFKVEGLVGQGAVAHKAAGKLVIEPNSNHFTSEDGKVDFRTPRTDLVKPSVVASVDGDTYTYTISNAADAKQSIGIVRFLSPDVATEVTSSSKLIFNGGWLAPVGGGIKPGESVTVAIKTVKPSTKGSVEMQFIGDVPPLDIPDNTPYGLRVLIVQNAKLHDHVSVQVVGPKQ